MKPLQVITLIIAGLFTQSTIAQEIKSVVFCTETLNPIPYVNIGIPNKNSGTVSDEEGNFTLKIKAQYLGDSLKFSCIGYESKTLSIKDMLANKQDKVELNDKINEIKEITVIPKEYKLKTLGVKTKLRAISAGFKENKLGYELGILMKARKQIILKKVIINFSACSYDSIFYRLNVYEKTGKKEFKNIMPKPYYLALSAKELQTTNSIDISHLNIISDKNLLITLEHVRNLGEGYLLFCAAPGKSTYYRTTSQAGWKKVAIGISISAEALVEK